MKNLTMSHAIKNMTMSHAMQYIIENFAFLARRASSGSLARCFFTNVHSVLRPTEGHHSYNRMILPSSEYCLSMYLLSRLSWYINLNIKKIPTPTHTNTKNLSIDIGDPSKDLTFRICPASL